MKTTPRLTELAEESAKETGMEEEDKYLKQSGTDNTS